MWLVADVTNQKGRKLVRNSMNFVKSPIIATQKSWLSIMHNLVSEKVDSPLIRAVEAAVLSQLEHVAKQLRSNSKNVLEGDHLEELLSENAVEHSISCLEVRSRDLANKLVQ